MCMARMERGRVEKTRMTTTTEAALSSTVTADGVTFKLPKGYGADGAVVYRIDEHRRVMRKLVKHSDGRMYIDEYMHLVPRNGLRAINPTEAKR